MANILFKIPKWPGSHPGLIRWSGVVITEKGDTYLVDTCNLIINDRDKGYWDTTVVPYSNARANAIVQGFNAVKNMHYADSYAYMWQGADKHAIEKLHRRKKYDTEVDARNGHLHFIYHELEEELFRTQLLQLPY